MERQAPFRTLIAIAAIALAAPACMPVRQPASIEQVAAIEISLKTSADRADLLAMLRRHAHNDGDLHVYDRSASWRRFQQHFDEPPPSAHSAQTKTIYVGVWRGVEDEHLEVLVDDGGHQGRPWLTFLRGEHPNRATKVRMGLLAEIRRRWPEAREIPVMPNGSLPLAHDLVWTGEAYVVKPDRIAAYAKRGG